MCFAVMTPGSTGCGQLLPGDHADADGVQNVLFHFRIEQGRAMGEPSVIFATIAVDRRSRGICEVKVGGHVNVVGTLGEYRQQAGEDL